MLVRTLGAVLVAASVAAGCSAPPPTWTEPTTGMRFVRVPAGTFVMGSPESEPEREAEERRHVVRLTRAFYIGVHEVTQAEWATVMNTSPSRAVDCGPSCPVENVNFHDARAFLARLSTRSGESLRLPTEAEWEYACRAGTTTPFSTGMTIDTDQANFRGDYPYAGAPPGPVRGSPTPVGTFPPNPWGIFDMHGNLWEWTLDQDCPYPRHGVVNPLARCSSPRKIIRGGSWLFGADSVRCAGRYTHRPADIGPSLGFRVVRDPR